MKKLNYRTVRATIDRVFVFGGVSTLAIAMTTALYQMVTRGIASV